MLLTSSFWARGPAGPRVCWGRVCEANYVRDGIFKVSGYHCLCECRFDNYRSKATEHQSWSTRSQDGRPISNFLMPETKEMCSFC